MPASQERADHFKNQQGDQQGRETGALPPEPAPVQHHRILVMEDTRSHDTYQSLLPFHAGRLGIAKTNVEIVCIDYTKDQETFLADLQKFTGVLLHNLSYDDLVTLEKFLTDHPERIERTIVIMSSIPNSLQIPEYYALRGMGVTLIEKNSYQLGQLAAQLFK